MSLREEEVVGRGALELFFGRGHVDAGDVFDRDDLVGRDLLVLGLELDDELLGKVRGVEELAQVEAAITARVSGAALGVGIDVAAIGAPLLPTAIAPDALTERVDGAGRRAQCVGRRGAVVTKKGPAFTGGIETQADLEVPKLLATSIAARHARSTDADGSGAHPFVVTGLTAAATKGLAVPGRAAAPSAAD